MAIDPKLVSIIPASQLPTGDPTNAADFLFYEGDALKKGSMSNIYEKITSGIKDVATTTTVPSATEFERWLVHTAGTYTNFSGIVVSAEDLDIVNGVANNRVILEVNNGVATKIVERVKGDAGANKIETWSAKTYNAGEQVVYKGAVYEASSNTDAVDLPDSSIKWVAKSYLDSESKIISGNTSAEFYSDNLKKGRTISYKKTIDNYLEVYLFRADDTFFQLGVANFNEVKEYTLLEDFKYIRFASISTAIEVHFDILSLAADIQKVATDLLQLADNREVVTITSPLTFEGDFKEGRKIHLSLLDKPNGGEIYLYFVRQDDSFVSSDTLKTNAYHTFEEDFKAITFYPSVAGTFQIEINLLSTVYEDVFPKIRTLVIGNSYSENHPDGLAYWLRSYKTELPYGSDVISLAVSSASVRDKSNDRVNNPYTSRPIISQNAGNLNTYACQIEKLKRLMAGTDLDSGEVKIYENEKPNVIIIQGAENDSPDNPTQESSYGEQFNIQVSGVYKRTVFESSPTIGSVYIPTPIENVDRTSFAGAYRYLAEELLSIFPDAQIFITTCSRISSWEKEIAETRLEIARQQRICAEILSFPVIDFSRDSGINTIQNHLNGSGTLEDPYVTNDTENKLDSSDTLHPNIRGGIKFGKLSANVVRAKFINLNNE